jgi:hypothetical protein
MKTGSGLYNTVCDVQSNFYALVSQDLAKTKVGMTASTWEWALGSMTLKKLCHT